MLVRGRRADHAGNETEVGSQSVVETVNDVAQKSAGRRLVPWLGALAGDFAERGGMVRRFAGEDESLGAARCSAGRLPMHVEIRFDFASFFLQQHRQQEPRTEPAAKRSQQTRAPAGPEVCRRMSVLLEEIGPDYDVPVLDVGQPRV